MHHFKTFSAWLPVAAGICLVALAAPRGLFTLVLAAVPAALMIAGGTRSLLFADLRTPQFTAAGSLLGAVLALPLGLVGGAYLGLAVLALSLLSFLAGGWFQIRLQPVIEDVPAPSPTISYSATVALDNAVLGIISAATTAAPTLGALRESARDSEAAHDFFTRQGYIASPVSYHAVPPTPESPDLSRVRIHGHDCEHLLFDSGYEPDTRLPGRDRWLSYRENRRCHTVILRHDRPGPWLVCVHGFGMGDPGRDFKAFRVAQLHKQTGINVALFTLPVHGARSPGGFGGARFFSSSMIDFVHAESQAIWDLRRLIRWIRGQQGTQVGVYGISLGAYTGAVLAGVEDDLACVIAAVPPTDMIAHSDQLAGSLERRLLKAAGVDPSRDRAVYGVVSPLSLAPLVPHHRRYIYAATGDQFVPTEQVRALWRHWEQPRISWCTGGHVSALLQRESRLLVDEAIAASLVTTAATDALAPV